MKDSAWLARHSGSSLARLLPRLEERFAERVEAGAWQGYVQRINTHFPRLFTALHRLYAHHYDFFYHLEDIVDTATRMWLARSAEMKALDASREIDPHWF